MTTPYVQKITETFFEARSWPYECRSYLKRGGTWDPQVRRWVTTDPAVAARWTKYAAKLAAEAASAAEPVVLSEEQIALIATVKAEQAAIRAQQAQAKIDLTRARAQERAERAAEREAEREAEWEAEREVQYASLTETARLLAIHPHVTTRIWGRTRPLAATYHGGTHIIDGVPHVVVRVRMHHVAYYDQEEMGECGVPSIPAHWLVHQILQPVPTETPPETTETTIENTIMTTIENTTTPETTIMTTTTTTTPENTATPTTTTWSVGWIPQALGGGYYGRDTEWCDYVDGAVDAIDEASAIAAYVAVGLSAIMDQDEDDGRLWWPVGADRGCTRPQMLVVRPRPPAPENDDDLDDDLDDDDSEEE